MRRFRMKTWHPTYTITSATAAALMQVEADRIVVEQTLLPKLISGEVDVENIDVQMPNNGGA
jgi:hypothetical protein